MLTCVCVRVCGVHCEGFALLAADSQLDERRQLDQLEQWLNAAEAVVLSLDSRPKQLSMFNESLALHSVSLLLLLM